jgi:membrane-associated phospholipid phosphatase
MIQPQSPSGPESVAAERPALWRVAAPGHFDARIPWWIKLLLMTALTCGAFFIDHRVSAWALAHRAGFWDLGYEKSRQGDIARELMLLEQFGQFACSVAVIAAVALIDRDGWRKALAIAIGCLATLAVTHLLKDCFGRTRPYPYADFHLQPGEWIWGGPAHGFGGGARWTSFPSAHTTGAFALAAGLSWFYPRGRILFMTLATITAAQRILHGAHFLSDTLAGLTIGVGVTRLTLSWNIAGRITPPVARDTARERAG